MYVFIMCLNEGIRCNHGSALIMDECSTLNGTTAVALSI